ncbi:OTU domain-containing protein [Mycena indigotica]|uniref:OTU domain-containing protein n=1 Tax=Mycena indigotica TaxID=2126181 RepID=A0A8H6T5U4_9AGAR|nr:OTU domain-containing protein [Mycena indigotica]KAF7309955.1 OTU domain-containing protein [Mycena indigotica]
MGKNNAKKTQTTLRSQRTRSSKGRLLSDPAHSTALLTDQLRSLGLYAANTIGDGNCLFRALSDQLYGTASRHTQLRKDVCDWIARHKTRYEPFVEDDRGIETHLGCMRQNATYGGHLELSAFAHLTRRNVKVIQPGLVYVIEWAGGGGPASPTSSSPSSSPTRASGKTDFELSSDLPLTDSTIYVAYHDWEHFSSVRNLRGPHTGLPAVQETAPYPYPSSPSPSSQELSSKQQSKADLKERKRLEKEMKERARQEKRNAHPDENSPPTSIVLPKVRLKLSTASPSTTPVTLPNSAATSSSSLSAPPSTPEPMKLPTRATALLNGRIQHSPKRSLEEVDHSASDGAASEGETSGQRHGREGAKRTRSTYHPMSRDEDADADGDIEMDLDANSASDDNNDSDSDEDAEGEPDPDVDTSSQYPPTNSTTSSGTPLSLSLSPPALSSSSSLSSLSSISPSPPPEPLPIVKPKPMTRRQRKALGLPKAKLSMTTRSASKLAAGKVMIPSTGDNGEWQSNGTGRLDVRGFRELRI